MRRPLVPLVVLILACLAACGRGSMPPIDGCTRGVSQEAYQTGMYECPDGTLVFIFATTGGRDEWVHAATQLGTVVESMGATWVKVREAG